MRAAWQESADIVVIGGGIFGCCAAYHLRRACAGRVVLLEREPELAAQTTWAAAGFISLWNASATAPEPELSIERYGLQFYRELAARHAIDLCEVGMAHVATTLASDAELRRAYMLARERLGAGEVALLAPAELHDLAPIVRPARVLWIAGDATTLRIDDL